MLALPKSPIVFKRWIVRRAFARLSVLIARLTTAIREQATLVQEANRIVPSVRYKGSVSLCRRRLQFRARTCCTLQCSPVQTR